MVYSMVLWYIEGKVVPEIVVQLMLSCRVARLKP